MTERLPRLGADEVLECFAATAYVWFPSAVAIRNGGIRKQESRLLSPITKVSSYPWVLSTAS